jgi:hypothetical protein
MSYVAAVCGKGAEVNQVKEQLLQSNPVLEGRILCLLGQCNSKSRLSFQGASRTLGGVLGGKRKGEIQAKTC